MKNLITYLKALWGAWGNLQSSDVRHDCRLTVGSPSFHRRSTMLKLVSVLVLILTVGVGNAWGAIEAGTYELITSTSGLVSGSHYIIVSSKSNGTAYAIARTSKSDNRATVAVTVSSEKVSVAANSDVMTFTLGGDNTNGWTFSTDNYAGTAGMLAATSSSNNRLGVVASPGNNGKWAITFSSGLAKPVAKGTYTRKYMKYNYNNGTPIFNCYSGSGSESLYIYKKAASGYSITYHCNGATSGCPSNASGQSALPNPLPTPAKTGFTFGGWYTDAALTSAASAGASLSANADLYAKWTCNVTLNRNGVISTINNVVEGTALDDIDGSGDQGGCSAWTFVGWSKTQRAAQNVSTAMTLVTEVDGAGPYYAVYSHTEGGGGSSTVTDVITAADLEATETSYVAFEDVAGSSSDAVYAGQSAKNGSDIQLRGTSPAGIVSTTSGGTVKSVVIEWSSSATDSRTINVYGKSTAYSTAADLYNSSTYGTNVGSITYTSSSNYQTTYNFAADYEYVGIRMNSSATRIASISITWTTSGGGTTYYSTTATCCTELASINGSFSFTSVGTTGATANWGWTGATTGISKNILKVYKESDNSLVATIDNISASATSQAITGLDPCTEYYVKLSTVSSGGGYCDGVADQTGASHVTFTTSSYTVTKTGVTNVTAASLSAIPATTCASGFSSITITAATGYALPAEIVVTNASKSWNSSTGALSISSVTGNVSITITPTCVPPVVAGDPADASYYVGDSPDALSVSATLASGTLTYLWKVSTDNGDSWSNAAGTNNLATYSGASLTTASAGTIKFKCIVGNSQGGCTVESAVATITVSNASYFPNGKTIFIQAESTSAWTGGGCVKAWFHTAGGSETAQSTYWLFDATGGDAGKKLFATVVPATGDLPYLDIQRFAANCSDWWNKNGGCSYSDANGSNTIRSTGKHDDSSDGDYIRWNGSGVTIDLHGDPSGDEWASSLASFSDQGAGVWTATYNNYAPANAAGESQEFKAKTNYNGWIGNTGNNDNATLDGMHVGSTYNITATLDVTDHSLEMSKTFVKGTVHFDLQGHGLAISDLENVAAGSKISAPSAPSATGYTFGGWFKEPACTNAWTFASDVVNETMTLYAKWTANVYTITKTFTNVANAGLPASFTYTGSTTTALNSTFTVDATNFFLPSSIAVTMGGTPLTVGTDYTYNNSTGAFTFSAVITGNIVITASATAKLKSIAITTQPTTRKYFAGESFSSTGAVVTATMGDGSTKAVTASTTWTPLGALSAGTGQTVTATYTEAGIEKTATTTIDVYSVTVNKVNEDGDAIDVADVTATWTVGTKALAAGVGSTKYAFKQWDVTGATAASTSSASTTLSSPTANVVVNAVFYKPRVVKWSVNGNDSYNTGSPTTTVAYNGTISTVPTAPSGLVCASTFIAWTDAAHNNGTTAKDNASYYGSALYTAAGDFPNITAETTTFYAVFAESGGAAVNTVMWSEDWTGATSSSGSGTPSPSDARPSAQGDHSGKTVYGGATITYTDGTGTYVRTNENNAGGTAPELLIKANENWTISGIPTGGAATLTLEYRTNGTLTVSTSTDNVSIGTKSGSNPYTNTITVGSGVTSFNLSFTQTSNRRIDNVSVKVASVSLTNYVTECDANIVKVTYNANGGSTSCTNTTTDKTEDFTVCGTEPTRDYYTFAGWLCSADDEVYAASATISAAAIDADFTLTAQWTPVPYSITYELYGGTNSGSNPATYNVTTATITLQDPTKGHDRFDGWYTDDGVWSDQVTEIPLGSHGNVTLYAKWATRHHIEFFKEGISVGEIWRADDENMEDAVAGQGTAPVEPIAPPTTCSSKVFVGWTEDPIDDETDDAPADLMKPAAGTVDEDKEFHAVWDTESSSSGTETIFTDDFNVTGTDEVTSRSGWTDLSTVYGGSGSIRFSSGKNAGSMTLDVSGMEMSGTWEIKFKIKKYGSDGSGALAVSSAFEDVTTSFSPTSVSTTDGANWTEKTITVTGVHSGTEIHFDGTANSRVYVKDVEIKRTGTITTHSAYSTSCCATKVTLSENSPEHGTIVFGKTSVGTCGGDKEVSLTITPEAGYQLHSYDVATGGGKVATKSVSPAISLDNNSSAVQNITLTFADEANGAYDVTASFSLMTVTSWTWTMHDGGGAIPDPLNLYVGQNARLDVAYTPAGVDASKKTYTRNKDNAYINWVGSAYAGYSTISGRATTGENTTEVIFTHADGPTKTVNVKVLPLPLTHFVDLVHGKAFADVAATIEGNALSATKTTPTSDDWTTPNANPCEENHLHLVGWIREDWPALVEYLNGTGAAPTTVAITGAGNDGEGHAYYIAAGASINVQTFDGVTFYAVWSKVE